jgi:hypothetical protein
VPFFPENRSSIYGQFEEEAPLEDVETQTPQAFEVESSQEADLAEVVVPRKRWTRLVVPSGFPECLSLDGDSHEGAPAWQYLPVG